MKKYIRKINLAFLLACLFLLNHGPHALAKEVKIVFTGQSFSTLYPCHCPHEPDGGVVRRSAMFKKLRAGSADIVFVEAGSSFASGQLDQYSQNPEADIERTRIYLKALGLMGYDALLVSGQEYSFGQEFLFSQKQLPFVSSNIEGYSKPYVIKDLGWIKVGILGLTDGSVVDNGVAGWQVSPVLLSQKVAELKKSGAGIVILLSSLTATEDQNIIKAVKGIDVVINGSPSYGSVNILETDGAISLTTWWQSRRVGVLTLEVSKGAIVDKKLEGLRLSADITDDEEVAAIVPQCLSMRDCKNMPGLVAKCEASGERGGRCVYVTPRKANLTVILPEVCRTCNAEQVLGGLGRVLGEMSINKIPENDPRAQAIIKDFNLTMLPAFLFPADFERSEFFSIFQKALVKGPEFYLLKPEESGVSYILGKKAIPKRLDVVFGFGKEVSPDLFELLKIFREKHKDIDVRLHLLAITDKEEKGNFLARGGDILELEELKRIACLDTVYPGKIYDYLICRSKIGEPASWQECLTGLKINSAKVDSCVSSDQGREAMIKRTRLTEDLKIASGPTFIIDNKEIFSIMNIPTLEEFESVVVGTKENKDKKK